SFTPDKVCETSLIPVQLWRYHYVVDIGTRRPLLNIFLFVIVETSLRESIEINSIKRASDCTDIP
ncbi:mucin-5AC, partial [Biomphalaria glabrata]